MTAIKTLIKKFKIVREETQKIRKAAVEPVIITRTRPEPTIKLEKKEEFVVQDHFSFMSSPGKYQVPPLSLLVDPPPNIEEQTDKARDEILASSAILEKKLFEV